MQGFYISYSHSRPCCLHMIETRWWACPAISGISMLGLWKSCTFHGTYALTVNEQSEGLGDLLVGAVASLTGVGPRIFIFYLRHIQLTGLSIDFRWGVYPVQHLVRSVYYGVNSSVRNENNKSKLHEKRIFQSVALLSVKWWVDIIRSSSSVLAC